MSRIADTFTRLRGAGSKALIAYVTVGYPSLDATMRLVPSLVEAGCDMIELGIPFSDPMADGPTIQLSSFRALQNGVTPVDCMQTARRLRSAINAPLIFMSYLNPVLHYGFEAFAHDAADAGIDGLIIPDLPPDEGEDLEAALAKHGLDPVYLLAPTSTPERMALVASRSRGFVYLVSVAGVTGARSSLSDALPQFVSRVRALTDTPLCVGFGISSPAQARQAAQMSDGVIVGSLPMDAVGKADDPVATATGLARELREALDRQAVTNAPV